MLFAVTLSDAQLSDVTTSLRETVMSGYVDAVPVSTDITIHPFSGKMAWIIVPVIGSEGIFTIS